VNQRSSQALHELLRDTSRSFYLTLRVLPGGVRFQIGLAYLLARTSDTIADTTLLPVESRLDALQALHEHIQGRATSALDFAGLADGQGDPAEKRLLNQAEATIEALDRTSDADRALIRNVLATIVSGQALDLRRFGQPGGAGVVALQTDAELDDYTYRVAGCVGEFWTRICRAHLFPGADLDEKLLLERGVRFGKGLQLVNILRDIPRDLRQGRCYVPRDLLSSAGLDPRDLLDPGNMERFRATYNQLLDRAEGFLRDGWQYALTLPATSVRVRLACAWPVLIGLDTLRLLRERNALDPAERIKISRARVRKLILKSVLLYPVPGAWRRWVKAG
jgi:farnesyl-diphosphate farnesyltransferase